MPSGSRGHCEPSVRSGLLTLALGEARSWTPAELWINKPPSDFRFRAEKTAGTETWPNTRKWPQFNLKFSFLTSYLQFNVSYWLNYLLWKFDGGNPELIVHVCFHRACQSDLRLQVKNHFTDITLLLWRHTIWIITRPESHNYHKTLTITTTRQANNRVKVHLLPLACLACLRGRSLHEQLRLLTHARTAASWKLKHLQS